MKKNKKQTRLIYDLIIGGRLLIILLDYLLLEIAKVYAQMEING